MPGRLVDVVAALIDGFPRGCLCVFRNRHRGAERGASPTGPPRQTAVLMLQNAAGDQYATAARPIAVRTSNSSGKKVRSSACLRKPTPLEPPVPRLKPMMQHRAHVPEAPQLELRLEVDQVLAQVVLAPSRRRCPRRCARTPAAARIATRLRPVAGEVALRDGVAVAREVGQRLVVERRRFERFAQPCLPSGSCANTLSMSAFLFPSRNSTMRYCSDWNPDRPEHLAEFHVFGRGERLQHRPHRGQLRDHLLCSARRSSGRRRARRGAGDRRAQFSTSSFSHAPRTWCWMMNRTVVVRRSESVFCGGQ